MEWIILALVMMTATMLAFAVIAWVRRDHLAVVDRLSTYTREQESLAVPGLNEPFNRRLKLILGGITRRITRPLVRQETRMLYEERLMAAGYPLGWSVDSFLTFKYAIFLITVLLGILSKSLLVLALLAAVGLIIPNFILKNSEKNRKEQIMKSLPDILDLLSVSVEAGLGFDQAIQKVVEKSDGPLADEFEKTLQEINMGKQRREALRDMANRVKVDDVTVFLSSIIQADQLGVSISNVLRLQSQQGRTNRRMRAEEKAQKTPIKMLVPLVLFVFPSILIVLIGPAVLQVLEIFGNK